MQEEMKWIDSMTRLMKRYGSLPIKDALEKAIADGIASERSRVHQKVCALLGWLDGVPVVPCGLCGSSEAERLRDAMREKLGELVP